MPFSRCANETQLLASKHDNRHSSSHARRPITRKSSLTCNEQKGTVHVSTTKGATKEKEKRQKYKKKGEIVNLGGRGAIGLEIRADPESLRFNCHYRRPRGSYLCRRALDWQKIKSSDARLKCARRKARNEKRKKSYYSLVT